MRRSVWYVYRAGCKHLLPPLPPWTGSGMLPALHAGNNKMGPCQHLFQCLRAQWVLHMQPSNLAAGIITAVSAKEVILRMCLFVEVHTVHCIQARHLTWYLVSACYYCPLVPVQCMTFRQNIGVNIAFHVMQAGDYKCSGRGGRCQPKVFLAVPAAPGWSF